jgi:hypothetical protein
MGAVDDSLNLNSGIFSRLFCFIMVSLAFT